MNFFNRFDNTDKSVVNFKPDIKQLDPQPQNVVRTVSSQPAPQQALATQPINTVKEKTMSSYVELQDKIKELQKQAEAARKEEISGIVNQIRVQVAEFNLSVFDIFPNVKIKGSKASGPKAEKIVKYRDDQGNTWAGLTDDGKLRRGLLPKWINQVPQAHGDDWLKYLEQFKV